MENNNEAANLINIGLLNWKIYFMGLIIGAIVGLGIYKLLTPSYEGSVSIQVGQVGQVGRSYRPPPCPYRKVRKLYLYMQVRAFHPLARIHREAHPR